MKATEFRRLALSFPEAVEGAHMGHADFRVGGRIFATLGYPDDRFAVVMLSPQDQDLIVRDHPEIFAPVAGKWGASGSTTVVLGEASATIVVAALEAAWRKRAPKRLVETHDPELLPMSTNKSSPADAQSASAQIDDRVSELGDWRGGTLSRMRALIKEADPDVVEEWKWAKATSPGVPVWSHDGIICTGESYKSVVKLTFLKGASLQDPARLFNSSLDGNARRAIDIHEGEEINADAFRALIRAAVALNTSSRKTRPRRAK